MSVQNCVSQASCAQSRDQLFSSVLGRGSAFQDLCEEWRMEDNASMKSTTRKLRRNLARKTVDGHKTLTTLPRRQVCGGLCSEGYKTTLTAI